MSGFAKVRYIPCGKTPEDYSQRMHRPKAYIEDYPEGDVPEGWRTTVDNEYSPEWDARTVLEFRDGDWWEVE